MKKLFIGFVVGVFISIVFNYGASWPKRARAKLINKSRVLVPGMSFEQVKAELGEPRELLSRDRQYKSYGEDAIPEEFAFSHDLAIYYIAPTEFLLIYLDEESRVVFHTSKNT